MSQAETFDYVVVNRKIEEAVDEIMGIIAAEKRRTESGKIKR